MTHGNTDRGTDLPRTTPPDPMVEALRAEYEAIAGLLAGAPDARRRDAAKARIVGLFKRTDAAITELGRLKEDIRELVDRYKQVAAHDAPIEARRFGGVHPQVHEDHIGASTFIEKGWSLISLGDHAGAVEALLRAVELSPGDLQAHSLLGWAQMLHEDLDDALATFSRVLMKEPGNALARVNVGYICLKKGIFGEAIEHLSRAIRVDNDRKATLYAHYYLGLVYLERGMYEDAQGFLRKALELGPNLIEAFYDLGRALWFDGRELEAREIWSRGAAANRFAPWAHRCRDVLERVERGGEIPRSHSS